MNDIDITTTNLFEQPVEDSLSSAVFAVDAKISYGRYLLLRSLHGAADLLFATLINLAAIAVFLLYSSYVESIPLFDIALMHSCGVLVYCLFVVLSPLWFLIAKCGSSSNGWTTRVLGLRVVDKNGQDISNFMALLRALVFSLTWFLLPIHLGFVIFGKRRMLHDVCTGAHVVYTREDPSWLFQFSARGWMVPALAALAVLVFCATNVTLPTNFQRAGMSFVSMISGSESKLMLEYLTMQYGKCRPRDFDHISKERAQELLPFYVAMTRLQGKYENVNGARYINYCACTSMLAVVAGDEAALREFIFGFRGK